MKHIRMSAAIGLTAAAVLIAGCSGTGDAGSPSAGSSSGAGKPAAPATESNPPGDIPDDQVFVAFRTRQGDFSVKVPEGWARSDQGDTTVYTDKLNSVQIATASAAAAPTPTSVGDTVVPKLRATVANFASPEVSTVDRHAGRIVLLTYRADSAKDPVTGKVVRDAVEQYAFYRSGKEVDVTLSGPVHADNVDPWRIISDSFTWR